MEILHIRPDPRPETEEDRRRSEWLRKRIVVPEDLKVKKDLASGGQKTSTPSSTTTAESATK